MKKAAIIGIICGLCLVSWVQAGTTVSNGPLRCTTDDGTTCTTDRNIRFSGTATVQTPIIPLTTRITLSPVNSATATVPDGYAVFRTWNPTHLKKAAMYVKGGTSVAGKLVSCTNVGASCSDITDSLTVNADAEGSFVLSGAALDVSLAADRKVYFLPTTVTGSITYVEVSVGVTVP